MMRFYQLTTTSGQTVRRFFAADGRLTVVDFLNRDEPFETPHTLEEVTVQHPEVQRDNGRHVMKLTRTEKGVRACKKGLTPEDMQ